MLFPRTLERVQHLGLFETRDGQAEALALAVRTTRYGSYSDGPHGDYSKAPWLTCPQTVCEHRLGEAEQILVQLPRGRWRLPTGGG